MMLGRRRNTIAVESRGANSIQAFFKELKSSDRDEDDLIIGCHANPLGAMFIDLDAAHSGEIADYEVLEQVDQTGTINIPAGVGKSTTRFHVKGCRIGRDECLPYLRLLKRALGNPKQVTAPKFFHCMYRGATGIFEWMGTTYEVIVKDAFNKREELVAAFQKKKFTQLDNTPVKDDDINNWVPKDLKLKPTGPKLEHKAKIPFPVAIVPRTGGLSAIDDLGSQQFDGQPSGPQCRASVETHIHSFTKGGAQLPKNQVELKKALQNDPLFVKDHKYPIYHRHLYANFEEFFEGQTWKLAKPQKRWIGSHYVYTLLVPVLKPVKQQTVPNELIFNFYPEKGDPTMNFLEDNARYPLFGQV